MINQAQSTKNNRLMWIFYINQSFLVDKQKALRFGFPLGE